MTGGSKGIGEGICRALAEEGAVPVVVSRAKEVSEAFVEAIQEAGGRAYFIEADLGEAATSRRVIEQAVEKCGRIDAVLWLRTFTIVTISFIMPCRSSSSTGDR